MFWDMGQSCFSTLIVIEKLRKITGNNYVTKNCLEQDKTDIWHLTTSNGVKTDGPKMMVDELAKKILRASTSTQYRDDFKKKKEQEEGKPFHNDFNNKEYH
jgi:hypothetical protein